jgi:transcriptional regulator with XRE-family HTH domain
MGAETEKKMTDAEVAEAIGVSRSYYSLIRTGRRRGNLALCLQIFELTALKTGDLAGMSDAEIRVLLNAQKRRAA